MSAFNPAMLLSSAMIRAAGVQHCEHHFVTILLSYLLVQDIYAVTQLAQPRRHAEVLRRSFHGLKKLLADVHGARILAGSITSFLQGNLGVSRLC